MAEPHFVATTAELPPGERKIVQIGGRSIGVFNVHGEYFAMRNSCPHQFAPLCLGRVTGTTEAGAVGEYKWVQDGEIVRCPWHGWEFQIKTGRSIFNPHKVRVKSYAVTVEPVACEAAKSVAAGEKLDEDPGVETFAVTTEGGRVFVHA